MMNRCFTWFPIGGLQNSIYNINRYVLQEMWILLGGSQTVKNWSAHMQKNDFEENLTNYCKT